MHSLLLLHIRHCFFSAQAQLFAHLFEWQLTSEWYRFQIYSTNSFTVKLSIVTWFSSLITSSSLVPERIFVDTGNITCLVLSVLLKLISPAQGSMSFWNVTQKVFERNFESKLAVMQRKALEPGSKYGAVFLWADINADLWLHFCAESPRHRPYESRILMLCAAVYSTFTAPQRCLHRCIYLCARTRVSFGWSKRTKSPLRGLTDAAL